MNNEIVFNSKEEMEATERVLASFKSQKINESIDQLLSEIFKYGEEADEILENLGLERSVLDKISSLTTKTEIKIEKINDVGDKKTLEELEDLVKRINTRIALVKESDLNLKDLVKKYDLDNCDLLEEIDKANLK